jgi:DNA-binding SARP family transcriptional activator
VRLLRSQHGLPPLQVPRSEQTEAPPTPKPVELEAVDPTPGDFGKLIQVRCFGGFEVRGPAGEVIPTVEELASGGPWDVLARLAASPEGTLSLQELIADVWPGAARGEAEDRLRSTLGTLHSLLLRGAPGLQADVVRFAPDDICHLDTRLVISDVHRFLRLCRAAPQMPADQARLAWQRARGLYRGALLDGPGARTWAWATRAGAEPGGLSLRDRYREHAYHATRGLARVAAAEGRLEDAVLFYRELLQVEPTLEDVVRELCDCYFQMGDYAAVREEEARLSRALHAAYLEAGTGENPLAYEPEPATRALFDKAHAEPAAAAIVAD